MNLYQDCRFEAMHASITELPLVWRSRRLICHFIMLGQRKGLVSSGTYFCISGQCFTDVEKLMIVKLHFYTGNELSLLVVHVFMHPKCILQSDWVHEYVCCGQLGSLHFILVAFFTLPWQNIVPDETRPFLHHNKIKWQIKGLL